MSDKSAIEWTDATWNPIVGCSIVSPGCTNCYAMGMAGRIERMAEASRDGGLLGPMTHYADTTKRVNGNDVWAGTVKLAPQHIFTQPLRWKHGRKIFVNSMGDLFHESIPDEWIDQVFAVMALCPQHPFQVLTKRAERMREYMTSVKLDARIWNAAVDLDFVKHLAESHPGYKMLLDPNNIPPILPNVWLGVSTERQQEADERIPHLLETPAAVRFISAEPLLGPIDLTKLGRNAVNRNSLTGMLEGPGGSVLGRDALPALDWVIVGGEVGSNARPMHPDWARSLRDQCAAAGVPFFFKQWGAFKDGSDFEPDAIVVMNDGRSCEFGSAALVDMDRNKPVPPTNPTLMRNVGKKAAGRLLDGKEHNEFPSRTPLRP